MSFHSVMMTLKEIGILEIIDILLVATIIYRVILMIRGTRAVQILVGFAFLFAVYAMSQVLGLYTLHWLLQSFLSSIVLVIVVLFQNDIRRALARFGSNPFGALRSIKTTQFVDELVHSTEALVNRRIGAIIVIERDIGLEEYIEEGIKLDAGITRELIISIFLPSSPIHDGGVIIRKGRIVAAGCFFPIATDVDLDKDFGTRHRAALGLSSESDAVILVVSEERGKISLVLQGEIFMNLSTEELTERLNRLLS